MAISEIISIGVSSIIMIILSKSRLVMTTSCCSMSYNDHNIDLSKINEEKDDEDEDEKYDDVPMDSFKTLPPPVPKYKESMNRIYDLRTLNK